MIANWESTFKIKKYEMQLMIFSFPNLRNWENKCRFFSEVMCWFCTNCPFPHNWITIATLQNKTEREDGEGLPVLSLSFLLFGVGISLFLASQVVFNPLCLTVWCRELDRDCDAPQTTVCSLLPTAPDCGGTLSFIQHGGGRKTLHLYPVAASTAVYASELRGTQGNRS